MKKELTSRQIIYIAVLILFGRLSLIGESAVGRDIWMVFIFVPLIGIPLMKIYSTLRVNGGVLKIFNYSLGKVLGTIAIILLSSVAIIIAASGVTLFTVFISSTPVENSITIPSVIIMSITIGILLYVSEGTLGKCSSITFPIVATLVIISFIFSIKKMDFAAVLPLLEKGYGKVFEGIAISIGLQVAPLIFLVLSTAISTSTKDLGKSLIYALLIGCALLMLTHLRNLLILGYPAVSLYRFPNYIALTQIKMGNLFQGMEIVMTQAFLLCQPIKSAICLRFVQRVLIERFPSTRRVWPFVLPAIAGILTLLNYGNSYDMIISNFWFRLSIASIMIVLPVIMSIFIIIKNISKRKRAVN